MSATAVAGAWSRLRRVADRLVVWLPVVLLGLMALGTYWLARNTPTFGPAAPEQPVTHDPDYFLRRFAVRSFDATGRLKSEVFGDEGRHYPDTDTLEIEIPRIRAYNERAELTVATAEHGLSNGDATEVQLLGSAVVTREATTGPNGQARPRLQIQGDFLHFFVDTEQLRSHKPVVLNRGSDQFTADSMAFDNLDRVLDLQGRVHGTLLPPAR